MLHGLVLALVLARPAVAGDTGVGFTAAATVKDLVVRRQDTDLNKVILTDFGPEIAGGLAIHADDVGTFGLELSFKLNLWWQNDYSYANSRYTFDRIEIARPVAMLHPRLWFVGDLLGLGTGWGFWFTNDREGKTNWYLPFNLLVMPAPILGERAASLNLWLELTYFVCYLDNTTPRSGVASPTGSASPSARG